MASSDNKIRYAVVGLGWFGQAAILPAFKHAAKNSKLAALVSGDDDKRAELAKKYDCAAYDNAQFEQALAQKDIDAVYIVTPNAAHLEYALRAARAGVHVLCEKPLADTVASARIIVDACRENGVKLMVAYRLHFQEANLKAIDHATSGKIGEARIFSSVFTQPVKAGNVRLEREEGGGPVPDLGVYCINAARYLFRAEPTEVFAHEVYGDAPKFHGVPENTTAVLKFPGGRVAQFTAGFATDSIDQYTVVGTSGVLQMKPGFGFTGDMTQTISKDGKEESHSFKGSDQIAPEIEYFSDCIIHDSQPEPDGTEGLIDMMIVEAIALSAKENRPVTLNLPKKVTRPEMHQHKDKPQTSEPELVKAEPMHE